MSRPLLNPDLPVFDRQFASMDLLVENLSDGVILLDQDGVILDANDAAVRLFGEPLPVGQPFDGFAPRLSFASSQDLPLRSEQLPSTRAARGETVRGAEFVINRHDMTRADVAFSASPVQFRDGHTGILLILHDISDRVRRDREAAAFRVLSQQLAIAEQDLSSVYRTIVTHIAEITGALAVKLLLYDSDARVLRHADAFGDPHVQRKPLSINGSSLEALAARTRLPVVVPDFRQYRRDEDIETDAQTDILRTGTGSAIVVPLIARNDLIGALSYDLPEPHAFGDAEIAFLGMIATQSAVAIYNATLFQHRSRERAFLAEIINHLPAGLVVFELVPGNGVSDYRVTMLNTLAASQLPQQLATRIITRRDGVRGLRIRRIATDEQSRRLIAWLDRALERGDIVTAEEVPFSSYVPATAATAPLGERGGNFWSGAVVPLRDQSGRVSELVLLATNVTEQVATRRRVEDLVRLAGMRAAEIEATVSAMADAVTVCDATGRITLANRAALETCGVESLADLLRIPSIDERIHLRHTDGEPVLPADRPLARALGGETFQSDFTMFHHGVGRDVHRRTNAAPVLGPDGDIIGAVAVETDITSLIEVDRLKDEFFSMAAHELRTPLTAIKGYTQILGKQIDNPDPLSARAIATLREQGGRMERLINELLDVARVESGQLQYHLSEFELVELLEQVVSDIASDAPRHSVVLMREPATVRVTGFWDRDRLAQVFSNLLTNAVKYSPDGGTITIRVERDPSDAIVSVVDEGIGIPAEHVPRLFARYSRVSDGRHFHQTGLGLGLYISREIIDAHGGTIRVDSAPGVGSTFVVTLPIRS